MLKNSRSIGLLMGMGALLPILYFLIFVVPANMDEFLAYHMLACDDSLVLAEHSLRESCLRYPAKLFGINFFKSYSYVGVSSANIYKIFYKIIPMQLSHYIYGLVVLVIFSFSLARVLNLKLSTALIPALYFPLLFPLLHDIGPIRIAVLAYPATIYLVSKLFNLGSSTFVKACSIVGIFFVVLVAVEDKPFFVYLIPQIFLMAFGYDLIAKYRCSPQSGQVNFFYSLLRTRKIILSTLFLSIAVLLALFIVLFCIRIPLGADQSTSYLRSLAGQVHPIGSSWLEFKYIFEYLITPIIFASRVFDISRWEEAISAFLFAPILLTFLSTRGKLLPYKYLFIFSILILSTTFIFTRNTAYPHHFVFLHIPIIFLLMQYAGESATKYLKIVTLLTLSSIFSIAQLVYGNVGDYAKFNKSEVFKYLQYEDEVKNSVINFSSWGGYYIQFLYGPRSQLITDRPIDASSGIALEEMRSRLNKDYIINVCFDCTVEGVSKGFPGKNVTRIGPKQTKWILWKISPRP